MSDVAPTLAGWMARQRWYATKGSTPAIRVIGSFEADLDGVLAMTLLVIDEAPELPVLYQVPVVARRTPLPGGDAAFIGSADDLYLYDAPHDPAYARHLFELMSSRAHVEGSDVVVDGTPARSRPGGSRSSRVLKGEQSNTSIIYDLEGGPVEHAIAKVFRVLHHGDNPDVTTQAALTEGGSTRVPTTFGSLHATWPDPGRDHGEARGHLAFSQEFLAGAEDAWRVALDAAAAGAGLHGLRAASSAPPSPRCTPPSPTSSARSTPTTTAVAEALDQHAAPHLDRGPRGARDRRARGGGPRRLRRGRVR